MFGKPAQDAPSLRESFEERKPMVAKLDARIHALAKGEKVADEPKPEPHVVTETVLTPEQQMASFTVAEGYETVSYTHLDVYKRQTPLSLTPLMSPWA